MRALANFQEYQDFLHFRRRGPRTAGDTTEEQEAIPPIERMEVAQAELDGALAESLLTRIMQAPPDFFESLVLDLLQAMGYGGTDPDSVRHLGRSGDGGVDGVIDQDRLGLDQVYVQAKRWDPARPVNRPDVQAFVGALEGQRAGKGVFITTARFSPGAIEYARSLSRRVVLIAGNRLTDLLVTHNVGGADASRLRGEGVGRGLLQYRPRLAVRREVTFDDPKIARAWHHLEEFNARCAEFASTQPSEVIQEPGGGYRALFDEPPDELAAIFGDFVHNLRSALDHAVTSLATPNRRPTSAAFGS